jgi:hypothetical protein
MKIYWISGRRFMDPFNLITFIDFYFQFMAQLKILIPTLIYLLIQKMQLQTEQQTKPEILETGFRDKSFNIFTKIDSENTAVEENSFLVTETCCSISENRIWEKQSEPK